MPIQGPVSVDNALPVQPSNNRTEKLPQQQTQPVSTEARPVSGEDRVEISDAGKLLEKVQQSDQVRAERLEQIKTAIEAGEYETPEKLEAALSKLLNEIGADENGVP